MRTSVQRFVIAAIGLLIVAGSTGRAQRNVDGPNTGLVDPLEVAKRFIRLDADGAQLRQDGWEMVAVLFSKPGPRRMPETAAVVEDKFTVVGAAMQSDGRATVRATFSYLGRLEIASLFYDTRHAGLHLQGNLSLVQTVRSPPGETATWRIEGPVPEPLITLTAAIRYATTVRDESKDEQRRKTVDRTLAAMRRQR